MEKVAEMIFVSIPIVFTPNDVLSSQWPEIREALLYNAREQMHAEVQRHVRQIRETATKEGQ
jgi:hypothetical protein